MDTVSLIYQDMSLLKFVTNNIFFVILSFSKCVTGHWKTYQQCSHCDVPIPESALNLRKCYAILDSLFPQITYVPDDDDVTGCSDGSTGGNVSVTRLNGETFDLVYDGTMTITQLKSKVQEFMKVHQDKQSLLYNGQKLQVRIELK